MGPMKFSSVFVPLVLALAGCAEEEAIIEAVPEVSEAVEETTDLAPTPVTSEQKKAPPAEGETRRRHGEESGDRGREDGERRTPDGG